MSLVTLKLSGMHHPTLPGQAASLSAIPVICMTQDTSTSVAISSPGSSSTPSSPLALAFVPQAGLAVGASCC